MNFKTIFHKKQTLAIFLIVFATLAYIVSAFAPLQYTAKSKLLLVQSVPAGTDPYTLSYSSIYLTQILAEVIGTKNFYDRIMDGGYGAQRRFFENGNDPEKTAKLWREYVSVRSEGDSGILQISVRSSNPEQALKISQAIFEEISKTHQNYHGGKNKITISVADAPLVKQSSPNAPLNFAVAGVAAIVSFLAYISRFPGRKDELKLIKK